MFHERFLKKNDLNGFKGDPRALGHPQRPRQAQPWGVPQGPQQVIDIYTNINFLSILHVQF